ncbi:MAG: flagellar motor stator protein MotA [Pirellula sp.]|nr:flagellar motor stator protein MotA [Pirellula sp.]
MIVIVGCLVVTGCVLGGFMWAGGHIESLIHPSEILTIGGASLGALIIMSPMSVLKNLMKGMLQALKGSPYNAKAYQDTFCALYELFRIARRDGLLALESHIADPHKSSVFSKYPKLAADHHATEFIKGAFSPVIDGSIRPEDIGNLMDIEIQAMNEEHHHPIGALSKTADALPGFGIVAAVLGIVITMGHIDGPPEEIGHKVGAALVGTFLGILASYGFIAPLVGKMELIGHAETAYFKTVGLVLQSFFNGMQPKMAIETGRRGLEHDVRPTAEELEKLFKAVESGGS